MKAVCFDLQIAEKTVFKFEFVFELLNQFSKKYKAFSIVSEKYINSNFKNMSAIYNSESADFNFENSIILPLKLKEKQWSEYS